MPYTTTCAHCRKPFDAMEAEPCSCIGDKGSFVCPHCHKCFCSAPLAYWKGFWAAAPQELWDRKREMHEVPTMGVARGDAPLVLVVDDHRLTRMTAVRALEKLGFRTLEATDGEAGLEAARKQRPALVLTDALMPKLDGREMCLRIKNDPVLAGTRVVIMTNIYTSVAQKSEGIQRYKADAYLPKPVALEPLRELLARLLAGAAKAG